MHLQMLIHHLPQATTISLLLTGSVVQVYCDMEGTNCGGEGGWRRVAYINMTQAGATCPVGLNQRSFNNKSYCGNTGPGCIGTMFPTLVEYSRVCGRVRGYQYGATSWILFLQQ